MMPIAHSDYPLALETMPVHEAWISDYQRALMSELGASSPSAQN